MRALGDAVPAAAASDPKFVGLWTAGMGTNAVVSVELPVAGQPSVRHLEAVRQSADRVHAERVVLTRGDLYRAVQQGLQVGTPAQPAIVRLLVNRAPCTACAQMLATQLDVTMAYLTPLQQASIRFEMPVTGTYEAIEKIPATEQAKRQEQAKNEGKTKVKLAKTRFTDQATTTRSLKILLESGWDVRALERHGTVTQRGEFLAGAIGYMRQYLGMPPIGTPPPAAVSSATPPLTAPPQVTLPPPPDTSPSTPPPAEPPPAQTAPAEAEPPPPGPPAEAAPVADAGEPWNQIRDLAAAAPKRRTATAAVDAAGKLVDNTTGLAAYPMHPQQAADLAFQASRMAYDAVAQIRQAYVVATDAAEFADGFNSPAAARARAAVEAVQGLWQRATAEYQAANARYQEARQGGPQAAAHAVEVATRARETAAIAVRASEAAERAVVASAQAAHGAGRARTFASDEAAADYGRQVWAGLRQRLTTAQETAAADYSGSFYRTINKYLRGELDRSQLTAREAAFVDENLPALDEALALQPTTEDVMVVRVTTDAEFDAPIGRLEGTAQSNPAYLSTSLATGPRVGVDQNVVVHLNVPAGTPALFMEATYALLGQATSLADLTQELLLGRDTAYVVQHVVLIGDRWHVFATVQLTLDP